MEDETIIVKIITIEEVTRIALAQAKEVVSIVIIITIGNLIMVVIIIIINKNLFIYYIMIIKKCLNRNKLHKIHYKQINTEIAIKLDEFKNVMVSFLEEKIYHYSLLNYDVKELVSLQKMSREHINLLKDYLARNNKITSHNFVKEKVCLFNSSTLLLDYKSFIDMVKYIHEQKEEEINNFLRDEYEIGITDSDNHILVRIRDDWRDSLEPDVLDSEANPVYMPNMLNKLNSEINKNLMNLLI